MSELKPGDRALIAFERRSPCSCPDRRQGQVVTLGGRYAGKTRCSQCGAIGWCDGFWIIEFVNAVRPHARLIRLPPDDECKRLFRETEKPREVSNA